MNYNTSFLELARSDITPSLVPTTKSRQTAFKLTQLIGYVKEPVKLLICFKDNNYKTYFALEKIQDCLVAPAIKQVQSKTVYENDVTLTKFLQVNFEPIQKIRYVETAGATLCAVEVTSQNLILPAEKELFWLDSDEVTENLAWQDREAFQALLLTV